MHLEIEAMRRAYLDRARFLGDPDFVQVPIATLLSKEHAKDARRDDRPGEGQQQRRARQGHPHDRQPAEPDETTHFSVIDRNGMAVSNTYTLEGGYGSRVVVKGAGFLLNNEMGDFNKNPGVTDATGTIGTPANLIDPGKRMLSSMTPTIVLEGRQGRADHRIAGRPHDHQHGLQRRAQRAPSSA